jgi:Coenzyme PQQ synthesis protein D (PqqD)
MAHDTIPRPARHVTASMHDTGVVLFHTANGQLFTSNLAGALIWQGLQSSLSAESIAEQLSLRYRIPRAVAEADTTHFLAQLEGQHLIERGLSKRGRSERGTA